MLGAGGRLIVIDKVWSSICPPVSATRTVKFEVDDAVPVGVPEITPVEGFKLKFVGSAPAITLQVTAPVPPAACNGSE